MAYNHKCAVHINSAIIVQPNKHDYRKIEAMGTFLGKGLYTQHALQER
jgi:hypothetical protein